MGEHKARKRFGQNFLHDQNIITRIIDAIAPEKNQTIIEIGPGKGALTLPLLKNLNYLHVIEIDRDLAQALDKTHQGNDKLIIHCLDALAFDFTEFGNSNLRIIGNLPYNISTPLIFHLLEYQTIINDMVFMLQEEVVDRICASPNCKAFGRLSVMVQAYCQTEKLFTVPPGAFSPAPKVNSAIVKLTPRKGSSDINDRSCFEFIVKAAFSQRRKTLRNCLKNILDAEQIETLGIRPDARAETLSVSDFIRLANLYTLESQ